MIIGLVGFIGSGKGTVADRMVRNHLYTKFSFADALKDAVASIFLWPRGLLEGDTNASRAFRERVDPWWSNKFGYEVTPRLILQKMGTEACRNNIHDDIWIHTLARRIQGYENVVIPDVRFPNEMAFIRSEGGIIVRVKRGDDPAWFPAAMAGNPPKDVHISEWAWAQSQVDHEMNNDTTIDVLDDNVNNTLTKLEKTYKIKSES